jgi:ComF family protein
MTVIAASRYEGPLVRLVMGKQWRQIGSARVLGKLVAARLQSLSSVSAPTSGVHFVVMIPVPLHWRRYAWRGYNQAYEVAREVRKRCHIPLLRPFYRVRHTPHQATLPKGQRNKNMVGAFAPCDSWERAQKALRNKHVLLIDDVYTTGATVRQLAKCVLRAGAASVTVAVACRA